VGVKSRLGQNFLIDHGAQQRIVAALSEGATVEIGPGKGAITELLAQRAGPLVAVELDPLLAAGIQARWGERITVLVSDILQVDLTALAAELGAERIAVVGNLPYYITSDILLHLFAHAGVISHAVLMVQREVAERIVAEPGSRDYGMLSATAQLHARCELLFSLPPSAFSPPPEVWSSVVRLWFQPRFQELAVEPRAFLSHLRLSFAQKRKTLGNNLRAGGLSAERVAAALASAGIAAQRRAETLTLEEQARLFHLLQQR
jgi:16S rRNA (adenine1518-N6/adenine1519-N6)-dimethyltransferase